MCTGSHPMHLITKWFNGNEWFGNIINLHIKKHKSKAFTCALQVTNTVKKAERVSQFDT